MILFLFCWVNHQTNVLTFFVDCCIIDNGMMRIICSLVDVPNFLCKAKDRFASSFDFPFRTAGERNGKS